MTGPHNDLLLLVLQAAGKLLNAELWRGVGSHVVPFPPIRCKFYALTQMETGKLLHGTNAFFPSLTFP